MPEKPALPMGFCPKTHFYVVHPQLNPKAEK